MNLTPVRRVGALLLAIAAVGVWFGLAPAEIDHGSDRSGIDAINSANNSRTEGAPQQTVVNGWTTNDYLELISTQLDAAAASDERPTALLLLGVLGIALLAATTPRPHEPTAISVASDPAAAPGQANAVT